jgi:hypothetical protein
MDGYMTYVYICICIYNEEEEEEGKQGYEYPGIYMNIYMYEYQCIDI